MGKKPLRGVVVNKRERVRLAAERVFFCFSPRKNPHSAAVLRLAAEWGFLRGGKQKKPPPQRRSKIGREELELGLAPGLGLELEMERSWRGAQNAQDADYKKPEGEETKGGGGL